MREKSNPNQTIFWVGGSVADPDPHPDPDPPDPRVFGPPRSFNH
jgi:hypothetical protein